MGSVTKTNGEDAETAFYVVVAGGGGSGRSVGTIGGCAPPFTHFA